MKRAAGAGSARGEARESVTVGAGWDGENQSRRPEGGCSGDYSHGPQHVRAGFHGGPGPGPPPCPHSQNGGVRLGSRSSRSLLHKMQCRPGGPGPQTGPPHFENADKEGSRA